MNVTACGLLVKMVDLAWIPSAAFVSEDTKSVVLIHDLPLAGPELEYSPMLECWSIAKDSRCQQYTHLDLSNEAQLAWSLSSVMLRECHNSLGRAHVLVLRDKR